ncbi:serine/threonine protein kinase [Streptomyces sp. WAC 01529]|uniref:serine/threonine-protein kinase n=1 Tax=Streptomyces sp. WAC 01529 TaxID=2203205 RepID=UPI000F6B3BFD|nr:protein kinase [Streptomyces sp. WAC 01529]AZM57804.1 serine/threonine protein kinase [Streptomyces sp. WAC 01529]
MNGADAQGGFDLTGSGAEPLRERDPRQIGTIPLVGRLGAGGMGRVYLGVVEGRYAAVKQMLASVVAEDEGFVCRFGQEMDNLARLPAGATAPLLASDRTAEPPWFATAYVPGITLTEAVEPHGGPLPADALWRLLRGLATGLEPVHALGMVHRDLKPSNIMLTLDGVTLIDFGIARAAEQSQLTQTGLIVGTPAYMSPEQASGKRRLTSASDMFTLGLLVAYAASGRWPFKDSAEGSPLYRIVHDTPDLDPLRHLAPRLAEAVAACLDKDPEGRPTAPELLELAAREGPSTPPAWPPLITDRLAGRAAFAANPPTQLPAPPPPEPTPEAVPPAAPPKDSRTRRRTRTLMAVLPVVVIATGTTLALQNLPYVTNSDSAAGAPPSTSATAPKDPSAPPDKNGSAKPESDKTEKTKKPKDPDGDKTDEDAPQGKGKNGDASDGDTANDGKNPSQGKGKGDGGSTDSDASDGDNESGDGGSDTDTDAPSNPTSGPFRLKNADNGSCLTQVYGAADDGTCGDPSARWSTVSAENNSFKVVNKESGSCLVANMLGQAVFVGDCTQGEARLWRWGPNNTLKSTANGGCLDLAYGGGISASTCQSGKTSQHWNR